MDHILLIEELNQLLERQDPNLPKKGKKGSKGPKGSQPGAQGQPGEFYDGPGERDPNGDVTAVSDQGAPYMSKCMCYGGKYQRLKLVKISCKYKQPYNKRYKDMNPDSGSKPVGKRKFKKAMARRSKLGLDGGKGELQRLRAKRAASGAKPKQDHATGKTTVQRYDKDAGPGKQKKERSSKEKQSRANLATLKRMRSQQKKGKGLTRKDYEASKKR